MKLSCIAIDDEPLALDIIEEYVQKVPYLELKDKFSSAMEAMDCLSSNPVDLIFLDIQMPELSGIDFLKNIQPDSMVILTTSYDQYAVESYALDVVDYLLKPIAFDRFLKAVNKALKHKKPSPSKVSEHAGTETGTDEYLFVKTSNKKVKIYLSDILFIEGLKDYVAIHVKDRKKILTLMSMKKILEKLPSPQFIQVHRSYIVALDKIDEIERNIIHIGDQRLKIGDAFKAWFKKIISEKGL